MDQLLTQIIGLLIIAVLVALAARWLKLPYTVGLVGVGIIMAATQSPTDLKLTPDFIFEFIRYRFAVHGGCFAGPVFGYAGQFHFP